MGRLVVTESVTLDGVMQAPARPGEDPRDGFDRGGWAAPYADADLVKIMARGFPAAEALLLGRRTYEDLASVWPHMPGDNPYAEVINNIRKYVASTTLDRPPSWHNSTLLEGDAMKAVARLKDELTKDLVVLGSVPWSRHLCDTASSMRTRSSSTRWSSVRGIGCSATAVRAWTFG